MSSNLNPYAAASSNLPGGSTPPRLADLGKRFLGAVIDGFAGLIFFVPGYALLLISGLASEEQPTLRPLAVIGILLILGGMIAVLGIQIWLLATRSQTLGKALVKTQIVDFQTGRPADFVHAFLLRLLVNSLISGLPCVGGIYAIVDVCFIFREDRRCIHDLIANTCVVDIS